MIKLKYSFSEEIFSGKGKESEKLKSKNTSNAAANAAEKQTSCPGTSASNPPPEKTNTSSRGRPPRKIEKNRQNR
jgi:hypothetical protein